MKELKFVEIELSQKNRMSTPLQYIVPCRRFWLTSMRNTNMIHNTYFKCCVSVLAFGIQVRGFTPGRSRRIFRAKKSSARLPSEGK